MDLWPFLAAFLLIGGAELGDKTQLLTISFAARYPFWEVISSVITATAVLMLIAVIFGGIAYSLIPASVIQVIVAIIFIVFGIVALLGKDKDEGIETKKNNHNSFMIIFSSFFIAELGDKTQLAAFALSAKYGAPFQVWLGATLGMVFVNILAALVGLLLKRYLSWKAMKRISGIIFIIFGIVFLLRF